MEYKFFNPDPMVDDACNFDNYSVQNQAEQYEVELSRLNEKMAYLTGTCKIKLNRPDIANEITNEYKKIYDHCENLCRVLCPDGDISVENTMMDDLSAIESIANKFDKDILDFMEGRSAFEDTLDTVKEIRKKSPAKDQEKAQDLCEIPFTERMCEARKQSEELRGKNNNIVKRDEIAI